jgi:hypothetical protein
MQHAGYRMQLQQAAGVCNDSSGPVQHTYVISYSRCDASKASKSAMQGHHRTNRMPSSVEAGAMLQQLLTHYPCSMISMLPCSPQTNRAGS